MEGVVSLRFSPPSTDNPNKAAGSVVELLSAITSHLPSGDPPGDQFPIPCHHAPFAGFCFANVTRTRPFMFRVPIFFTTQGAFLTFILAPTVSYGAERHDCRLVASRNGSSKFMAVRFRGINFP